MDLYYGIILMKMISLAPRVSPGDAPGTPGYAPGTLGHAPGTPGDLQEPLYGPQKRPQLNS